jgi:hypothetical protein
MLKMVERMKWRRRGSMVAMWCSCDRWDVVKTVVDVFFG